MKIKLLTIAILAFSIVSCNNERKSKAPQQESVKEEVQQVFQNKAHELVYEMVQKAGNYGQFRKKGDVVYTYTYSTPDGKTDVSTEKYIFDGELSYGKYERHDRTFSNLEGLIEQGYDGAEFWLKHNGTVVNDEKLLKRVAFNRPTNFYWFAMMPKLLDPGLNYERIEEKDIDGAKYDVVRVSFESKDDKPKDVYQLYINKETKLVDQFLFTVMDFGRSEPLLMRIEYDNIEGLLIPSKRRYKGSNWDAEVTEDPWVSVNWTNIKFDNKLTKADFSK